MTKIKDFIHQTKLLSIKDIYGKIGECQKKIAELNQGKILGKVKNHREIRQTRRQLARLMTIMDQKLTEKVKE